MKKSSKVHLQILNSQNELEKSEGVITKILRKANMPALFIVSHENGLSYFRRENELKLKA